MPSHQVPTILQSQWFVPLFVLACIAIGGLLSVVSGWRSLARRFPGVRDPEGERFHFASAKMGLVPWFPVNYGGFLAITVGKDGLAMSIYFPFRFLCPDFFVPWSQVESVTERASALSRRMVVKIRGSSVWLALRGPVGDSVATMHARAQHRVAPPPARA